jgi:hypothetical protein
VAEMKTLKTLLEEVEIKILHDPVRFAGANIYYARFPALSAKIVIDKEILKYSKYPVRTKTKTDKFKLFVSKYKQYLENELELVNKFIEENGSSPL